MTRSVLLVGLGQIGMEYDLELDAKHIYTHARAFASHPGFRLVGAVDPDRARRETFVSRYRSAAFESLDKALTATKPQVVIIAVPTSEHGSVVAEILASVAPEAILCEKPLAAGVEEAKLILDDCLDRGVKLWVNYIRRSEPGAIEVARRIDAGLVKSPMKGIAWYSKGLLHNGSHFFNLLERWLGSVSAARIIDRGRSIGDADAEPDFQVVFEKGAVVFLSAREEAYSHYTIELLSDSGRLRYDAGGESISWQGASGDPRLAGHRQLSGQSEVIPSDMTRYQWHVADDLDAALEGRSHSLCTGAEALSTLQSIHSILEMR